MKGFMHGFMEGFMTGMPARRQVRNARPSGRPLQAPAQMTNGEINREVARLTKISSAITQEMIAAGRGHELPSETSTKTDDLSMRARAVSWRMDALQREGSLRYGPGYHSGCLPRGGARE